MAKKKVFVDAKTGEVLPYEGWSLEELVQYANELGDEIYGMVDNYRTFRLNNCYFWRLTPTASAKAYSRLSQACTLQGSVKLHENTLKEISDKIETIKKIYNLILEKGATKK